MVGLAVVLGVKVTELPAVSAVGSATAAVGGINRAGVACPVHAAMLKRVVNDKIRAGRLELIFWQERRDFISPKRMRADILCDARPR